jgi:predicted transposase YbfD/YdcC
VRCFLSGTTFLDHFSALDDPRQACKVVYPLAEILLLVLCGTIAGAETFVEIERWGEGKLEFLRRFLPFAHGIPAHDTLNDVINALPSSGFAECFTAWVDSWREAEPDLIAMDGKTSRRARRGEAHPLPLVSAWASRQHLVLGQEAVAEKSNEITALPLLLERLELTGALVTIDAMGCQRAIAETIRAQGADYLLALKDNQPTLAQDVRLFFEAAPLPIYETTDGDHGRIEVRRHQVSYEVDCLTGDRRFPEEPRFPDLAMVAIIEAEVERNGKTTTARRYYLSSAKLEPAQFARAVRAHWGIENRLHWVLDVVFHDDLMRLRTDNGPANRATIRHAALNLMRAIPEKASLNVKRKTAAWNENYLFNALTACYQ